jgi:hypothetical protein
MKAYKNARKYHKLAMKVKNKYLNKCYYLISFEIKSLEKKFKKAEEIYNNLINKKSLMLFTIMT